MLEVVRELVDAVDSLKGLAPGRRAELHASLDQTAEEITGTSGPTGRALTSTMLKPDEAAPDVPAGT